ncbi:MAG: UpxY family transcription antiterminator [Rikenellaceae bacterium]
MYDFVIFVNRTVIFNRQMTTQPTPPEQQHWYAMKATYGRAMHAKCLLDALSVESFVPMIQRPTYRGNRGEVELMPAISNLIFIHTTKSEIANIMVRITYLRHTFSHANGKSTPLTVPSEEMSQFIAITQKNCELITYIDPESIDLSKGDRIRITAGAFSGHEGILMKINGKRSRQVVVAIEGVVAVALARLSPRDVEKV